MVQTAQHAALPSLAPAVKLTAACTSKEVIVSINEFLASFVVPPENITL
jgi:hypothetical protein